MMSEQIHSIRETDQKYVANTYNRFPVQIERGSGSVVFDENGKRYIDLGSAEIPGGKEGTGLLYHLDAE